MTIPSYNTPHFEGRITWTHVTHDQFIKEYTTLLLLFGSDQLKLLLSGPAENTETLRLLQLYDPVEILYTFKDHVTIWLNDELVPVRSLTDVGWLRIDLVQRDEPFVEREEG